MISKLAPFVLAFASLALAAPSLHGVRNPKCAPTEADARQAVAETLGSDTKLCEAGETAIQSGGWSCRNGGGDCKKGTFRCNTQYTCEAKSSGVKTSASPIPAAPIAHSASPTATPNSTSTPAALPTKVVPSTLPASAPSEGPTATVTPNSAAQPTKITTTKGPDGSVTTTTTSNSAGMNVTTSLTQSPEEAKKSDQLADAFAKKIFACAPMKTSSPFPLKPDAQVVIEILGLKDGKCEMQQSLSIPGSPSTFCKFSEADRTEIAKGGRAVLQTKMLDASICKVSGL